MSLIYGVGFNDGKYKTWIDGKQTRVYRLWAGMLRRCYFPSTHNNKQASYVNCKVSENFKSYSYFHEWFNGQVGCSYDSFQIDKDLLVKGNKIYSEDICVLVPHELNTILVGSDSARGKLPIGVSYHVASGKFQAKISKGGKRIHLGVFESSIDAYLEYKKEKELYIKEVAAKWKNSIDQRAYEALMSYNVDISD